MRKLPLSSVVVTKQEEDSRISRVHPQHRSGPFKACIYIYICIYICIEVAREDVGSVARYDVMRTKNGSMSAQLFRKDLCKLIWMKEFYVQDKLAHGENCLETTCEGSKWEWSYVLGLAMNMPIVSDAAPVTWSICYWRRQSYWGCGCCWFCCKWRHADGVPREVGPCANWNQPGRWGGGGLDNYEVSCDWRFQPPIPC